MSKVRKKRSDTKMGTIEKKYGKDFGVRSDKQLSNYLKEKGYNSLNQFSFIFYLLLHAVKRYHNVY